MQHAFAIEQRLITLDDMTLDQWEYAIAVQWGKDDKRREEKRKQAPREGGIQVVESDQEVIPAGMSPVAIEVWRRVQARKAAHGR